MAETVPLPVPGSAGYSDTDWRKQQKTILARHMMKMIISRSVPQILGMLMSEAHNHVAAVEKELFYLSNSLHDYIDTKTLAGRIFYANHRKIEYYIVSMSKNNGSHAEGSHLIGSPFKSVSSLPLEAWAEHPAYARKYWQDTSGVIVIDDRPPPLPTNPAEHLVPPVGSSSGSAAFCYPPHLVAPVGSSNGSTTFCNPSRPPYSGSVYGEQTPHGQLFYNNLSVTPGGQYSQGVHGKNVMNILDDPLTDQSGASVRKYRQGKSNGVTIHATPPPLDTYPTECQAFPAGSSSGSASNPPCPPYNSVVEGRWTTPRNGKRTRDGLPCGSSSSGIPGGQYLQRMHGDNILCHQGVPLNSLALAVDEYLVSPGGTPGSSTGLSNSPHLHSAGTVSGGEINLREGKHARYGPTFGNYPSESAAIIHQLNSTGQSVAAPGRQCIRGKSGEHIAHDHDAPLTPEAVVGVEYPVSHTGSSHGSTSAFSSPRRTIVGPVHSGGVRLEDSKQAHLRLSSGKDSSQREDTVLRQICLAEQSGAPGRKYPRDLHGVMINNTHNREPMMENLPGSVASIVGTSGISDLLKKGTWAEGRLPILQHSSESPFPDLPAIIDLTDDDESQPNPEVGAVHIEKILSFRPVDDLKTRPPPEEPVICNELKVPAEVESTDVDKVVPHDNLEACAFSKETKISTEEETIRPVHLEGILSFRPVNDSKTCPTPEEPVICYELKVPAEVESMNVDEVEPHDNLEACGFSKETKISTEDENTSVQVAQTVGNKAPENEILETESINGKSLKTGSSELFHVSLTESLSEEQLLEHLSSLGNSIRKGSVEEVTKPFSENICQLCGKEKIFFEPSPCSTCCTKLKKNGVYYSPLDESNVKFCRRCYDDSRKTISNGVKTFDKEGLCKRITKEGLEEDWVQCDKCKGWQHQVCTLYNQLRDKGEKAKYTCPSCCLIEIKSGERLPTEVGVLNASNLSRTSLSDHIEQRLLKRLKEERELRATGAGKGFFEVPGAEDLTVRVVLTEKKNLKVKEEFLDLFKPTDYPPEFPYTSKMILLFQKIGVVDVILFGFYAQEYGSDCGDPNGRCIYISFLDSIKYFRPNVPTATGEALRSFAYHEILIGYLDYCKKRGFVSCHIWSCPPWRGQDYLFYHHPRNQRTPTASKLTNWYQTMLKKAVDEKVVVSYTNMYEYHYRTSSGSRYQVSATRLPFFEGDSWFNFSENVLKEVDEESKSNYQRKRAKIGPKHNPKTVRCVDALYDSKDFLFMQKLGKILQHEKKDFIVMHLRHVCSHCHKAIASGKGWFCSGCAHFLLCERCHDDKNSVAESHRSNKGEEHSLSKVAVDILPSSTDDEDGVIENLMVGSRHRFLKFCQDKHYQFDTLRRAKHSSMMVLHFLNCPNDLSECSICTETSLLEECWTCETCPDFRVCLSCHKSKDFNHRHPLTHESDS